jgi:hypothetical protein
MFRLPLSKWFVLEKGPGGESKSSTGAGMRCARTSCLALSLLLLAGCGHEEGRGPLTNANMAAEIRDQNLPPEQRIANIQNNPNIPAPEKERMVRLLKMQTGTR